MSSIFAKPNKVKSGIFSLPKSRGVGNFSQAFEMALVIFSNWEARKLKENLEDLAVYAAFQQEER